VKATHCYSGPLAWAKAHAAREQRRVGTLTPDGRRILAVQPKLYGLSKKRWCVTESWQYIANPSLGVFGENVALLLPLK
jgi:hypothetical protein